METVRTRLLCAHHPTAIQLATPSTAPSPRAYHGTSAVKPRAHGHPWRRVHGLHKPANHLPCALCDGTPILPTWNLVPPCHRPHRATGLASLTNAHITKFPHHPQGNNPIKSIPNGAFTNLTKLRRLDLVRDAPATLMPPCYAPNVYHTLPATPAAPSGRLLPHPIPSSRSTPPRSTTPSSRASLLGRSLASRACESCVSCVMCLRVFTPSRLAIQYLTPPCHVPHRATDLVPFTQALYFLSPKRSAGQQRPY